MPRLKKAMPQLTPGQAGYVLERMVKDRRLSAGDINRYVSEMQREISDLEMRLQNLRQASGAGNGARAASLAGSSRIPVAKGKPAKRRVSAEQRASRLVQGRYLGLIRQIPASKRAQYQKIAKERGREAAIKELVSALGK